MESRNNIGVAVRIRPLLQEEVSQGHQVSRISCDQLQQRIIISMPESTQTKIFKFDQVLDQTTSQQDFFESCNLSILISKLLSGFNVTIFAYGQTGSGKTYTMEGYEYDKNLKPIIKVNNENVGVVPRVIKRLFEEIKNNSSNTEYTVYCTYIQVYKERIYDLLNPAQLKPGNPGLKLRWNKLEEFYIDNLFMHACYSPEEVMMHYHSGLKNKIMASHNLNSISSRSHTLFTLTIEALDSESGGILSSKLQLVDLAGSERPSITGNEGIILKESIEINKSLFTLRQVITALSSQREGETVHVPYRDSKLTSILKQSIGGNGFTLMIACLAPSDAYLDENLSTLSYASKALSISNIPVKNIDPKSKMTKKLRDEIKNLKQELSEVYQQIDLLSEISILEKKEQAVKLREIENMPFKSSHIQRIQALRNNIESAQSRREPTSSRPPPTAPAKNYESDNSGFGYSTEVLAEKLDDSVKLFKLIMNSNRKLKEDLIELKNKRKAQESEILQLHERNQNLREKAENFENAIKEEKTSDEDEIMNLRKINDELAKKIMQLEKGHKQIQAVVVAPPPKEKEKHEWGFKSTRTVVRAQSSTPSQVVNYYTDKAYETVMNFQSRPPTKNPNRRNRFEKSFEDTKGEMRDSSLDSAIKADENLALSQMFFRKKSGRANTNL
ncbi:unnamed protein product [Blepharisma stoltei]|uniref:Kinesin-like protein n=1 Tax=Blepharisma stoltei TaxID=1481888 RepID=A0AAU9JQG5_9CILI|nr:unnamed protein product [Blepharisma stoltei]